jgi:hypothetical protein
VSLDLAAIRNELAALVDVDGFNAYSETLGSFDLDAVVVGVPVEDITIVAGFYKVPIPVYVLATSAEPEAAEARILAAATDVIAQLEHTAGTAYQACRFTALQTGITITVGSVSADAAIVKFELHARQ